MEPSTEEDPIQWAGVICCPACGRVAYPLDAAWVAQMVLIVDYGRPCTHVGGAPAVVDLRGLDVEQLFMLRMSQEGLSRYVSGRRCLGRNRFRKPCRAYAAPGSDYCDHHASQPAQRHNA